MHNGRNSCPSAKSVKFNVFSFSMTADGVCVRQLIVCAIASIFSSQFPCVAHNHIQEASYRSAEVPQLVSVCPDHLFDCSFCSVFFKLFNLRDGKCCFSSDFHKQVVELCPHSPLDMLITRSVLFTGSKYRFKHLYGAL